MDNQFLRTHMLLGGDAMNQLHRSHVAVFGLGGVGSYAVEALVRSGVGELTLIDDDTVSPTNLNRQLEALHSTLGQTRPTRSPRAAATSTPMSDCTSSVRATMLYTARTSSPRAMTTSSTRSTRCRASSTSSRRRRLEAFPSSPPWARETSWMLRSYASRTSPKRATARLRA